LRSSPASGDLGDVLVVRSFTDPMAEIATQLRAITSARLCRATVLLPAERHAHALRRYVCTVLREPQLLAGVTLLRPVDLAREVVVRGGVSCAAGWEDMRRLRIGHIFESTTALTAELQYFNREQLRSGRGYADAFARTIGDLEDSGLECSDTLSLAQSLTAHEASTAMRLNDVAVVWRAADASTRQMLSAAEILARAATLLQQSPALASRFGSCITLLSHTPSVPLLRFMAALADSTVVIQEARPLRAGTQRWRQTLSCSTPLAVAPDTVPLAASELAIVHRYLFEVPEVLTAPTRPRSSGADRSIETEEHASVEEEIEAAVSWISDQMNRGVAAEHIALLVPDTDPYAALLIDRIARLAVAVGKPLPIHVAGGLAISASPAGLRVVALLRALRRGLDAESTIRLLPWLRHPNEGEAEPQARLSPTKAARLVYETGIVGGSTAHGTSEWVERLSRRREALRALTDAPASTDRKHATDRQQAQRVLKDIERVLPAITDLQRLALAVQEQACLTELWPLMRDFCKRWLRLPPDPPSLPSILDESLAPLVRDPIAAAVRGRTALSMLADAIERVRRTTARFGEPCLFIGTPSQAAGLTFRAVRVLGMAEGVVPHSPHDDPILPDDARAVVEKAASEFHADVVLPRITDRVLDEIHDVFRVIATTTDQLSLSVPRQSVDRSDREVSGILLEVATALGRTSALSTDGDVPTAARLRSTYFHPGRTARELVLQERPLSPRSILMATPGPSHDGRRVPADWTLPGARSLPRLAALQQAQAATRLDSVDGVVGTVWDRVQVPGLSRDRPVSATAMRLLIDCPHRFLLERILFWKEPARRPPTDTIDPIAYGNLFHAAAERFFSAHGAAVCKHDQSEAHWITAARATAAQCFEERIGDFPLRGTDSIRRERHRLLNQMEYLVRYEWRAGSRNYYASELPFGDPDAIALRIDGGDLYLRGAMDRVDQVSSRAFQVRDLKTGRVHDFIEEPVNPSRDLQIGVYVLVLESLRLADEAEVSLAAYVHPSASQEPDRSFVGIELDALRRATRSWLELGRELLRSGSFPRTPDARDCTYCPFVPVCADNAHAHSEQKLLRADQGSAAGRFLRLKKQRGDDA